jgi:hypothetical protein
MSFKYILCSQVYNLERLISLVKTICFLPICALAYLCNRSHLANAREGVIRKAPNL